MSCTYRINVQKGLYEMRPITVGPRLSALMQVELSINRFSVIFDFYHPGF